MDNAEALRALRVLDGIIKRAKAGIALLESVGGEHYQIELTREELAALCGVHDLTAPGYVRVPVENGKNRYGLDMSYFRNVINRELNRPLHNYKPDELARICFRIGMTADKAVLSEREFQSATKETPND